MFSNIEIHVHQQAVRVSITRRASIISKTSIVTPTVELPTISQVFYDAIAILFESTTRDQMIMRLPNEHDKLTMVAQFASDAFAIKGINIAIYCIGAFTVEAMAKAVAVCLEPANIEGQTGTSFIRDYTDIINSSINITRGASFELLAQDASLIFSPMLHGKELPCFALVC